MNLRSNTRDVNKYIVLLRGDDNGDVDMDGMRAQSAIVSKGDAMVTVRSCDVFHSVDHAIHLNWTEHSPWDSIWRIGNGNMGERRGISMYMDEPECHLCNGPENFWPVTRTL